MATRSYIGIRYEDGSFKMVYCHNDGYVKHNGLILYRYYLTRKKVERLLENGDMSALDKFIDPDTDSHDFFNREEGVCVFYHRDRGEPEEQTRARRYADVGELLNNVDSDIEYIYFYDVNDGGWYVGAKKLLNYDFVKLSFIMNHTESMQDIDW